ncbi:MAG TPA: DEAD/DEAH box helicase [Candidatus Saccharimonadales bacterium]|nr:DEAD/DEAH box helicase [Candidatus Saccharimonadales bacterium]
MQNSNHRPRRSRPSQGGRFSRPVRHVGGQRRGPKNQAKFIHPDKFINKAKPVQEQVPYEPTHTFADFGFPQPLQKNVDAHGYVHPTPIQDGAIKPVLEGRDLIGLANTGTGKTAAFLLPILSRLVVDQNSIRALIVAPTRELAVQIDEEFRAFSRGLQLYSALCVGGVNIGPQIRQIQRGPHIIIGTPGRLKDLVQQKALRLGGANMLVLDEADRMLDMGFIRDIQFLINQLSAERQSLCFSATITPEIRTLLDNMLKDPVTVSVRTGETSDHVEQDVVHAISKEHKIELLEDMLRQPDFEKVIVFGQTKHGVQRLAEKLSKAGIPSEAIHGNKSQGQRQRALDAFKKNNVRVLVATDVAARGLDIPNVSHVINFDQPNTYEEYVHRIGRTGRAGKQGKALTFVAK